MGVRVGACEAKVMRVGSGGWAHLILLRELEAVVGLEPLRVLCHVCDGDWRVAKHT